MFFFLSKPKSLTIPKIDHPQFWDPPLITTLIKNGSSTGGIQKKIARAWPPKAGTTTTVWSDPTEPSRSTTPPGRDEVTMVDQEKHVVIQEASNGRCSNPMGSWTINNALVSDGNMGDLVPT